MSDRPCKICLGPANPRFGMPAIRLSAGGMPSFVRVYLLSYLTSRTTSLAMMEQ